MSDIRWYTTLALWKSAVFLEGSYKRRLAGTTEDAFFDPLKTGLTVAVALRDLFPEQWQTERYDRLLVHKATYEAFKAGKSVTDLRKPWAEDVKAFRDRRRAFLLYPE